MVSLADHFGPTLGTSLVKTTLTSRMRLFVPALGANAVASGAGAGFVAATLTTATLTTATLALAVPALSTATLAASTTKVSVQHSFISLFCRNGAWKVQTAGSTHRTRVWVTSA